MSDGSNTHGNFYRLFVIFHRQYLRIFIVIFVILAVVVGLSIQEVAQPDSSLAEGPEIVEAGGKIIGVNLHDGIKGSLGNG